MPVDELIRVVHQAFWVVIVVSAPVVGAAFVTALLVSAFQSVTQLHDAAVGWAPKIAVGLLVLWVAGGWMSEQVLAFGRTLWRLMPS